MRTVNLRRSVVHILRRLSPRSRGRQLDGNPPVHPVIMSLQAEALRTLRDHSHSMNHVGAANAQTARVEMDDPLTRESIRLALESEDYNQAQFILERLGGGDERDRLMLNLCRCVTGDLITALMDLRDWSSMSSFPDDARTLYALLLDEEGEHVEALRVMLHEYPYCDTNRDGAITKFLGAVLLMRNRLVDEARIIARRLPAEFPRWQRLGLIEGEDHEIDEVGRLTDEIIANESVLKSLVEGLRCDPVDRHVKLLTRAVARALDHFEDRAAAFESLGVLHSLAGHHREARKWVLRGLREFPRNSSLLLFLLQLPSDYQFSPDRVLPHVGVASRVAGDDAKNLPVDARVQPPEESVHHAAISVSRGGKEAA